MARRWSLHIALLAAAGSQPASSQVGGEHFAPAPDPTFVRPAVQRSRDQFFSEAVPTGEALDDWSRMITIAGYRFPAKVTAEVFASQISAGLAQACPGARQWPIEQVNLADRRAVDIRIDCPLNPQTGKPETMFGRFVRGTLFLDMIQIAFRHTPSAIEAQWAKQTIAQALLCFPSSVEPRCG